MLSARLPILFGYLGTLPFVLFMLISFLLAGRDQAVPLATIQILYGVVVTSFLGGVHWGQAVPSNNVPQLVFAMSVPLIALCLMGATFVLGPVLALLGLAGLFWVIYFGDKKYMPEEYIPEAYYKFRRRLTIIVSVTLFLSAIAA